MNTFGVALVLIAFALCALSSFMIVLAFRLRGRFRNLDRQIGQLQDRIAAEASRTIQAVKSGTLEAQTAAALQTIGWRGPLFLGGWSIDAFLGKLLVNDLLTRKPRIIVELGSGSSTLLIAQTLRLLEINDHRHIVVDHDAHYLDLTREHLRLNGLSDRVELWLCPLVDYPELRMLWYGDLVQRLTDLQIDTLVVDGPPSPLQRESRLPAIPLLSALLAKDCVIFLDDANREDERAITRKWTAMDVGLEVEIFPEGHGVAVFRF